VTGGEIVLSNENEFRRPRRETRAERTNGKQPSKLRVPWPDPPNAAAHIGIVGDLVRMIEPHTESDPAALLLQTLTAFGSLIGRSAHFTAEADKHFCNLNVVLVGDTRKGRKGTSLGHVMRLMEGVDESWKSRQQSGTGEGLIHAVRDQVVRREPIREKGRITGYEEEIADDGVQDKRLLVVEPESAQVESVHSRQQHPVSNHSTGVGFRRLAHPYEEFSSCCDRGAYQYPC